MIPRKKREAEYDDESETGGMSEEERAALKMLQPEQRKMFLELEQSGANPAYLKRKLKQALQQSSQQFFSNEARAFI